MNEFKLMWYIQSSMVDAVEAYEVTGIICRMVVEVVDGDVV